MGEKYVGDNASSEIDEFSGCKSKFDNIQAVTTSSTLPNAVKLAAFTSSLISAIQQYQHLIESDAEKIKKYIDGMKKADSD